MTPTITGLPELPEPDRDEIKTAIQEAFAESTEAGRCTVHVTAALPRVTVAIFENTGTGTGRNIKATGAADLKQRLSSYLRSRGTPTEM